MHLSWRRWQVFALAWVGFSTYRVIQLLFVGVVAYGDQEPDLFGGV